MVVALALWSGWLFGIFCGIGATLWYQRHQRAVLPQQAVVLPSHTELPEQVKAERATAVIAQKLQTMARENGSYLTPQQAQEEAEDMYRNL